MKLCTKAANSLRKGKKGTAGDLNFVQNLCGMCCELFSETTQEYTVTIEAALFGGILIKDHCFERVTLVDYDNIYILCVLRK